LRLLLLFLLVLFRQTAAEDTARHGADDSVMARDVAGDAADDRSLDAAFCVGLRGCECECDRYGRED
jgi:hypothetical protein